MNRGSRARCSGIPVVRARIAISMSTTAKIESRQRILLRSLSRVAFRNASAGISVVDAIMALNRWDSSGPRTEPPGPVGGWPSRRELPGRDAVDESMPAVDDGGGVFRFSCEGAFAAWKLGS